MKEMLFEKTEKLEMSCPNFKYNSWRLFGSYEENHENQIIVEISAEFMATEESPLLGLACRCLVFWRVKSHLLNSTSSHTAVNRTTASCKSMASRRTAWQVPTLRRTQVQYILSKSSKWS